MTWGRICRIRLTRFGGRVAAKRIAVTAFDPVRETGARTDNARFTPAPSASVVLRQRVAVRSPMSGAPWWATKADGCGRETLIRTFHRDAPARRGAFADERRIVAGNEGAECGRETLIQSLGSQSPAVPCPRAATRSPHWAVGHRRACASLVASFAAGGAVVKRWPELRRMRAAHVPRIGVDEAQVAKSRFRGLANGFLAYALTAKC